MSKAQLQADPAISAENEGIKKPGRPRNVIPINSLMRGLPTTADRLATDGMASLDFSMTAEVLAVLGAITLERALGTDEVSIEKRVEWTLRLAPFLGQLREGFVRRKGAKLPATTQALAEEASKRSSSIKTLMAALGKPAEEAGTIAAKEVLPDAEEAG